MKKKHLTVDDLGEAFIDSMLVDQLGEEDARKVREMRDAFKKYMPDGPEPKVVLRKPSGFK